MDGVETILHFSGHHIAKLNDQINSLLVVCSWEDIRLNVFVIQMYELLQLKNLLFR